VHHQKGFRHQPSQIHRGKKKNRKNKRNKKDLPWVVVGAAGTKEFK
jgi:hypothetical protein